MEEAEALARASVKEQLGDALRSITEDAAPPGGHALIIDGKALLHALADEVKASLLAVRPPHELHACQRTPIVCEALSALSSYHSPEVNGQEQRI